MTFDDIEAAVARIADLERRISELETAAAAPTPLAYTLAEVSSRYLPGVSVRTLREWVRTGKLRARLTPGERVYLVSADDLRRFLDSLLAAPPTEQEREAFIQGRVRAIISKQRTG